jgi:thiol-disulfide isomerase/thioredoxin
MLDKKVVLIIIVFLLFGCGERTDKSSIGANGSYRIGDKIIIKSVTNTTVTIVREKSGFKIENSDKILIFDIFGTYCQPCITEAPQLANFQLKYEDDILLIGLVYGENISDEYVLENFLKPLNIHYFISNSPENRRIINSILKDINYPYELAIPFKVVLKNSAYQELTNIFNANPKNNKFYIGKTDMLALQKDIENIKTNPRNF